MAQPVPLFVECPHCGEVVELAQTADRFFDTQWTDAFNCGWALRGAKDELFRGISCGKLFWKSAVLHTRSRAWQRGLQKADSKDRLERYCDFLTDEPYHLWAALEEGLCPDADHEMNVRMRIWWGANNPFRPLLDPYGGDEICQIVTAKVRRPHSFISNFQDLVKLLSFDDVQELLLRAEIYRELEAFEECCSTIDKAMRLIRSQEPEFRDGPSDTRDFLGQPKLDVTPVAAQHFLIARSILNAALGNDSLVRPVPREWQVSKELT